MTQYTRSVIPGRAQPDDRPPEGELDRMVFGRQQSRQPEPDADAPVRAPRARAAAPDNDDADDDAPPEALFTGRPPRERRETTRRKTARRKTDYAPLDAGARETEGGRRGPLILIVTIVVIGVFGAVVWNAYSSGLRAPDGGPTPELASAGPFKTRPAVEASKPADIDASVFERVEKTPQPATTVEVRPQAPEPKVEPKPEPAKVEVAKVEPAKVEAARPAPPAPPKPAPVKADPAPGAPIRLTPSASPSAPASVAAAASKPAKAEAVAAPPALEGGFHPAFAASGAYVVQLAAPSTEAAAEAEWARRAKAAPGLLEGAEKLVVKADVNGKTVYRLRAGSFAASADADKFCAAIKASGGACFIAKK